MYTAAEGAGAKVLVTEWHVVPDADFPCSSLKLMGTPALFDGRNMWGRP